MLIRTAHSLSSLILITLRGYFKEIEIHSSQLICSNLYIIKISKEAMDKFLHFFFFILKPYRHMLPF